MTKSIAIIGAGIAGVAAARELAEDADVCIFEKSRGLGGRMATRRAGDFQFDHGAQFFTARSREFQQLIDEFGEQVVCLWEAKVITLERGKKTFKRERFETHYVAQPLMNSLVKRLSAGLEICTGTRVESIEDTRNGWRLIDDQGVDLGTFDWVVSSLPAPQAQALLPIQFNGHDSLESIRFSPCYALMLGLSTAPRLNFDAALVRNEPLGWIAVNHGKPGRDTRYSLLLHSDNHWAENNASLDAEEIIEAMTRPLLDLTGISANDAAHSALHRWLYAKAESNLKTDYLLDPSNQLAVCGDWCRGNRVEDAFLSGHFLGGKLRTLLSE